LIKARFAWNTPNKPVASKAGVVEIQRRLVKRVLGGELDPTIRLDALALCEGFQQA
jgi:hypothetical protein